MNIHDIIRLGTTLQETEDAAHDLWTHLPSYKIAVKYHDDYAMEFRPSADVVMREACEFIYALSQNAEKEYHKLTDRMADSFLADTGGQCVCGEFHSNNEE